LPCFAKMSIVGADNDMCFVALGAASVRRRSGHGDEG
jgi:hypothetical protein